MEADSFDAARLVAAAVERDPADGFALAIYGHVKAVLYRDYRGAIGLFERALEAAPGNAMAWTLSSGVYSYTGQTKSAIERAEMGLRLSPVDTQSFFYLVFLALAHYVDGNYDESIIWGRKSAALNPRLCSNLRWLIGSLVAAGKMDEARHFSRAMLEVNPEFRLSTYDKWCPLVPDLRKDLLGRLQAAGVPV
jgi:tetratricopeptide (TPR) repeat protein